MANGLMTRPKHAAGTAAPLELDEADSVDRIVADKGKCTVSGCDCPAYVEPPGGFECKPRGHEFSDHR